jgi:hypothetical protein
MLKTIVLLRELLDDEDVVTGNQRRNSNNYDDVAESASRSSLSSRCSSET